MDTVGAPSDPQILATLAARLYRTAAPLTSAERARLIADAAAQLAAQVRSREQVEARLVEYEMIRTSVLAHWGEVSFDKRMLMREIVLHIDRFQLFYANLKADDREALLAALPKPARDAFTSSLQNNRHMADDIRPLIEDDVEVRIAPTSDQVWNVIKKLDPRVQEALHRPLDRSKYVRRDLRKAPRRTT